MFKLVIEDDDGNKTVVPIIRDEITIGRKDGNTIRLTERNVSRDHARLVRENGGVFLEDVSARYGTKKNGEKLAGRTDFSVGDVFTIGDYRLTLQSDVVPETKPPKKPNGASPPPLKSEFSNQPTQMTSLDSIGAAGKEGTEIIAAEPAKLVIVSSNFAGQEFPLARKEMVIGRGEECDIIIDHRSVSQKHAKIVRETNGEYKIVDLKSKNGVKVGGEEYRAVHLKRGDIVELGHVKFRFVEAGENYVFTPQFDDESGEPSSNKKLLLVLGGVLLLVGLVVAFIAFNGTEPEPEAIASNTNSKPKVDKDPVKVDEPDKGSADLTAKIDKAEQDYLAGQVEKALGALEFLREEKLSPDQTTRLDELFTKARREKALALHLQTGKSHFDGGRWMEALSEFHEIPDDEGLNVYVLLQKEGYVDKAIVSATEQQLDRAKASEGAIDGARDALTEIAALYPSHPAPTEGIAELDALKPSKPKVVATTKPPRERVTPAVKADPALADQLYAEGMKALIAKDPGGALSAGKEAISYGCTARCYRVMGMAHHQRGDSAKACDWFKKSGSALPTDLQCD